MEVWPGPIEETFNLLQEEWPTKGKKEQQVSPAFKKGVPAVGKIKVNYDRISRGTFFSLIGFSVPDLLGNLCQSSKNILLDLQVVVF